MSYCIKKAFMPNCITINLSLNRWHQLRVLAEFLVNNKAVKLSFLIWYNSKQEKKQLESSHND